MFDGLNEWMNGWMSFAWLCNMKYLLVKYFDQQDFWKIIEYNVTHKVVLIYNSVTTELLNNN